MQINKDIYYVGVDDHKIDLFEGIYRVPNGMSYNSYVIMDEKTAVLDTVEEEYFTEWMNNIKNVLGRKKADYLIVQHMEPDHSANIMNFLYEYPEAIVVASQKAFTMMVNFFGTDFSDKRIVVSQGDSLYLGRHELMFIEAPMVHWPEVIMTYDKTDKVFFSADAFGKFGAMDVLDNWMDEARRYYFGIIGKFGGQVQKLLEKIRDLDIRLICPLHGPILDDNIEKYMDIYNVWSAFKPEEEGVLIAYTTVYGNTRKAVEKLSGMLKEKGCKNVIAVDLSRGDMMEAVAEAFRYSKLVLATTTYNSDIFPSMREFINCLTERNFTGRMVAFVENGSWASVAAKIMRDKFEKSRGLFFAETSVKIMSALNEEAIVQLEKLADELVFGSHSCDRR